MTLFKNGGTCATPMTLKQRIKAVIRSMGAADVPHPENTQAKWGNKNVH